MSYEIVLLMLLLLLKTGPVFLSYYTKPTENKFSVYLPVSSTWYLATIPQKLYHSRNMKVDANGILKTERTLGDFQTQNPFCRKNGGNSVALLWRICTYSVCMDGRFGVRACVQTQTGGLKPRQINTLPHVPYSLYYSRLHYLYNTVGSLR
jgi:hypothetical protein